MGLSCISALTESSDKELLESETEVTRFEQLRTKLGVYILACIQSFYHSVFRAVVFGCSSCCGCCVILAKSVEPIT